MNTMELLYDAHTKSMDIINLIASEAWFSPEYKLPYIMDMYHRYSYDIDVFSTVKGLPTFSARPYFNKIEERCIKLLKYHFDCAYASVKPISGLNMMVSVLSGLTRQGDKILSMPPEAGGHSATRLIAQRIGLSHDYLPIKAEERGQIKVDCIMLREMMNTQIIRCIYIDLMHVINSIELSTIRNIVGPKCTIIYDASHVLGLILGGKFQNPLREGADVLIGSTHKTFPGPHKGVVLTNNRWLFNLYRLSVDMFISHHHFADVAALSLILEHTKKFFSDYADRIVENSKIFVEQCNKCGINAMGGNSHQVWIDTSTLENLSSGLRKLDTAGILVNEICIPFGGNTGLRIGLQEVTFRGMKREEVRQLCSIICHLLQDNSLNGRQKSQLENLKKRMNESYMNGLDILTAHIKKIRQSEVG